MEIFSNLFCPLCGVENKTIDHLFIHCAWSKSLWLLCMSRWDVNGCFSLSISDWMEGWNGLCPEPKMERIWFCLFFAIVWSIWESRNQEVFDGKSTKVE